MKLQLWDVVDFHLHMILQCSAIRTFTFVWIDSWLDIIMLRKGEWGLRDLQKRFPISSLALLRQFWYLHESSVVISAAKWRHRVLETHENCSKETQVKNFLSIALYYTANLVAFSKRLRPCYDWPSLTIFTDILDSTSNPALFLLAFLVFT